jgi:hypothetical protein
MHRWREPNIRFLKKTLNVMGVEDVLKQAVERLVEEPKHAMARHVQADFPLCIATLESRCAELPRLLETIEEPIGSLE